jgi:hypothetical protein
VSGAYPYIDGFNVRMWLADHCLHPINKVLTCSYAV